MQQSNEIVTFSPCASSSVNPGTAKALRKSTWDPIDGNEHMLVAEEVSFFRLARPSRMPVCLPAESLRGEGSPVPPPLLHSVRVRGTMDRRDSNGCAADGCLLGVGTPATVLVTVAGGVVRGQFSFAPRDLATAGRHGRRVNHLILLRLPSFPRFP